MNKTIKILLSLLMIITLITPYQINANTYVEEPQIDYLKDMCGGIPQEEILIDYSVEPLTNDHVNGTPTDIGNTLKLISLEVKNALLNQKTKVSLTKYKIHESSKLLYFGSNALTYSIPYLTDGLMGYVYYDTNRYASYMIIDNPKNLKETKALINKIDAALDQIYSLLDINNTDEQNALILHEFMVSEYEYDTVGVEQEEDKTPWQIGGMLLNKKGVCMAYSLLYRFILEQYGIETNYVVSDGMNHAWNIIRLRGEYYHVDVTWDDPIPDYYGLVSHNNYLRNDEGIIETGHYGWDSYGITCDSNLYEDFYWTDIKSPIVVDGTTYYSIKDRQLRRTDYKGNVYETINNNVGKWSATGGRYYTIAYSGLFMIDNDLYYNTPETVYKYNTASKTTTRVFTPSTDKEVYGCRHISNRLYFNLSDSPKESDVYYANGVTLPNKMPQVQSIMTNIDKVVLNVGEEHLFHVYPYPSYCSYNFSWKTNDYDVVAFGETTGNLIAKSAGITTITITSSTGLSKDVKVIVLPFTDVSNSAWYKEVVGDVYDLGLMSGASETLFKPDVKMNRGMVAIVLHRMEGAEPTTFIQYFKDVDGSSDEYYASSVTWAKKNGVINGYGDNTFRPLKEVSREEMAQMLYNFAVYKGTDVSNLGTLQTFNDGTKVSSWHKTAVRWAVGNKLITGKDNGTRLDPQGKASRAECAKMLVNAYNAIY